MMNNIFKFALFALSVPFVTFAVAAFDDDDEEKKDKMKAMGKDPMAIAEMQCENARKEAAENEDIDEKSAEEKCAKATEQA